MTLKTSSRGDVPPFIVMDVLRAANEREAQGASVVHLEVGQPSSPAPEGVRAAAARAAGRERLGYTDALGTPALRERIARHYGERYGVDVDPARVVATTGSSGAFLLAFLAAFDAGDRVGVLVPGYPAYRNILSALGLEPVLLEAGFDQEFSLREEALDAGGRLDGLVLASPANPTGVVLDTEELRALADACAERGIRLISDEIYHGIEFEGRATTAAALAADAVVVNSFSKYYSMTGWRLGWMVLPEPLVRPVERLAQNLYISPPGISQAAAVHAFDCAQELDGHVERYRRNRDILVDALPGLGFRRWAPARGAFYLYVDVTPHTCDSVTWAARLLDETGVAVTPGTDFDPRRGHESIRISFAGSEAEMVEAVERLSSWLQGIQ